MRDDGMSGQRAAGAREGTAKALIRWRALTGRVDTPFGNAAARALGLRTAGRVQADTGSLAQVLFYAGVSAPYWHDEFTEPARDEFDRTCSGAVIATHDRP
ncbi:hypothetical protein [Curtobacterium sp. MCBD17_040]|uniref:hypothetical protein n=1 Tax=Curtobacterium sp. MCBD17_040 TaxID=2175674 RepID=UPI0011B69BA3|nr:hypothetical protein [Curtobacterium sp. MCBD17_040]WIB62984.1 hypothetical protein DEI94_12595 [Curtobacterium sp. MCBD17_040]